MCGEGNPWICCGLPLEHATTVIGISDVLLGGLSIWIFGWWVYLFDDYGNPFGLHILFPDSYRSHQTFKFPHELYVALVVASGFQVGMGIVLTVGAIKRSTFVCMLWMIISSIGVFLSFGFLLRIYEIWVVYRYYEELRNEQQVRLFNGGQMQFPVGQQQQHQSKVIGNPQQQMRNMQVGPSDMEATLKVPQIGHVVGIPSHIEQ